MLNCKEASELMSHQMDDSLPFGQRLSLRFHLLMCHGCSNFMRQIKFLRKAAQRWRPQDSKDMPQLSEDAKRRIAKVLHAAHGDDHSHENNRGKHHE